MMSSAKDGSWRWSSAPIVPVRGLRANGVRSTTLFSLPVGLSTAVWWLPGVAALVWTVGRDAVERLGGAVAGGEDPAVVAEDAVLAGAAGDPVVAPAADDVVVARVAVHHVVAAAAVDGVVAALAVDLVGAPDVDASCGRTSRTGSALADSLVASRASEDKVGATVRAARGVVEQGDRAGHEARERLAVAVVGEGEVRRAGRAGAVGPDQAQDVAVVADDRVAVDAVAGHAVAARALAAAATEDQVVDIGTLARQRQAEQVAAAADEVVAAAVAEEDVVAAPALDVVVAVRPEVGALAHGHGEHAVDPAGRGPVVDVAVALHGVVAELGEDL